MHVTVPWWQVFSFRCESSKDAEQIHKTGGPKIHTVCLNMLLSAKSKAMKDLKVSQLRIGIKTSCIETFYHPSSDLNGGRLPNLPSGNGQLQWFLNDEVECLTTF